MTRFCRHLSLRALILLLELRVESFNLLNHFNWGSPATNFNSGQFGRITTQAGAPRIMQLGVKYAF